MCLPGVLQFTEHGVQRKQGKRTDLDGVRDLLADGGSVRDVLALATNYQCVRFAEKHLTYLELERDFVPEVRSVVLGL